MSSLLHRLKVFIQVWALKAFVRFVLLILRTTKPILHCQPTLIKTYPTRPRLHNRVFVPRAYVPHGDLLPLYVNIHGGGWTVMDAEADDEFCSYFANTFGVLIVSIDYHKAPRNQFPGPVDDVAAMLSAVLADTTLPIDQTKVAIGGFSAGGNLALAVSQKQEFQGRIKAAVCFYALVDFSTPVAQKTQQRLRPDKPDMLGPFLQIFEDAYVPDGTDVRDPLLSPIYADREVLPEWLYLICGEEDSLCPEGRAFAEKMSVVPKSDAKAPHPVKDLEQDTWEHGTVKWELVRGVMHSFTHLKKRDPVEEIAREKLSHEVYARVFGWLQSGPWA